ncbi:hypothetical protein [Aquabacterium sp. OR-4]|uniref:hypothetical protein n=1 Tax=Aquabacterium sp. OR-4 TaxID=2978127 RepID=UPI0028CAE4DF|nr:hypothetical protein [Aquabacterium sp. OR-4]MDT7837141.1 hypothetical protein [Aquabacterium sp. OR-4]
MHHLVLSYAGALTPAAAQAASTLALPRLERLLARLSPTQRDGGDELSLTPPHERAWAAAAGWPVTDGLLPLAAAAAQRDGLAIDDDPADAPRGWGLLSPTHWHFGTEQASLMDPAGLALDDADARELFDALLPLFNDEGWALLWGAPTRWYLRHASLAELPTASLDRVVGRNVDPWLTTHPQARPFRRRQAEAQMLLHTHPVNARREARGKLPVNSFWLSGTGRALAGTPPPDWQCDHRLREPALAEDWAAWAEAWGQLDDGPLRALLARAEAGEAVALTLAGERQAQRYEALPRGLMKRWFGARRVAAAPLLETL